MAPRQPMHRARSTIGALLFSTLAPLLLTQSASADEPAGAKLYAMHCASCHGEKGEGVADAYAKPLAGDRSLVELTSVIEKTMPEGAPEDCVGEEAKQVAEFVYDAFYSRVAQARIRPARVEFSRLTVRQYEESVADLLASFTGKAGFGGEQGLDAEYYADRRFNRGKRVEQRVDPRVDFDYGEGVPIPEKTDPEAFSIKWRGSLIAPETGDYEFVLRTENGARLSLNGEKIVDVWVKSGDETEHRGSTRLLGGRAYPVEIEFFTFKEKTASIRFEWKRPHHALEVVPQRALSTQRVPSTFVVRTPFPPDDASEGYERGSSVSKAWYEAATRAALEVAQRVVEVSAVEKDSPDREKKAKEFCRTFVQRAFRRTLPEDEVAKYVDPQFEAAGDPITAVKRVALMTLVSPRFLYRRETGDTFDQFDTASWLSYGMWDSLPDETLLQAAARGELATPEQVRKQAERMINDARTTAKLASFARHWLRLEHFPEIGKDAELFPGFEDQLLSDVRTSLEIGVHEWLMERPARLPDLLLDRSLWVNGRMAEFYGIAKPEGDEFVSVETEGPRVGLISHPYLLTGFAYDDATSPIHRGVFIARSLLGRRLRPPPVAVSPLAPDLHPSLTTRERVELQTQPETCRSCHGMINPLGFALESFDAVGRFREKERDRKIDDSGHYLDRSGERTEFAGVREFVDYLAASEEVHEAFAEQLFQYAIKQPVQAWGPDELDRLRTRFAADEFDVHDLLVEIVTSSAVGRHEILTTTNETTAAPPTKN